MQVQIRGITSMIANAYPLYVVDGVIVNNETVNSGLNTITQSDGGAASSDTGSEPEPDRGPQPRRHRDDRGPQGRLGIRHLRLKGLGRRDHHHDQEGQGRQAPDRAVAESRTLLAVEYLRSSHLPDARQRGGVGQRVRVHEVVHRRHLRRSAELSEPAVRQQPAVLRDGREHQWHLQQHAVFPVRPREVRQRHHDQHRLQQANRPCQHHADAREQPVRRRRTSTSRTPSPGAAFRATTTSA